MLIDILLQTAFSLRDSAFIKKNAESLKGSLSNEKYYSKDQYLPILEIGPLTYTLVRGTDIADMRDFPLDRDIHRGSWCHGALYPIGYRSGPISFSQALFCLEDVEFWLSLPGPASYIARIIDHRVSS